MYKPKFQMTLSTQQAWMLEIALTRSLASYQGLIENDPAAHPNSCIGVQQMILRELKNAQHGRRSEFIKTLMVDSQAA